jgi:cytoskeletal protein CcmA (bactofilin family)
MSLTAVASPASSSPFGADSKSPLPHSPIGGRPNDARATEGRTLTVGEGLSLSGTISACDRLVVAGTITANIAGCRDLQIGPTGRFEGTAAIEFAEIAGRFEGKLEVSRRLRILATGRVSGTIRCAEIEVERGGQLSGDVQMQASVGG